MRHFAIKVRGIFNGIYEWGEGFKSRDIASRWNWYWKVEFPKKGHLFWKYAQGGDFGECGYLTGTDGSIYMHPMDFNAVLVSSSGCVCTSRGSDGKDYYNHFQSVLRTLKEICDECAEFCGGTFDLLISKEFAIETPDIRELIDFQEIGEDGYAEKIGVEREQGSYIY